MKQEKCNKIGCNKLGKIKTHIGLFCSEKHRKQIENNIFKLLAFGLKKKLKP